MDQSTTTPAATTTSTETASAPVSSPAPTTQGAMSARDAIAFADSSSAAPATPTPAETTPAAATVQPDGQTETPDSTSTKGEPPKWRWQDILANARETAAKEAADRVEQQYGWAKGMKPDEVQGALIVARAARGDQQAIAQIAQVAPEFAQSMGWARTPAADAKPEPDLQAQDGTLVYSAQQMERLRQWDERRLMQQFEQTLGQKLQPVQQVVAAHERAVAHNTVAGVLQNLQQSNPEFAQHKADVAKALQADPDLWALADSNPKLATELAWNRVYREKVLPEHDKSAEAKVLASLQQRAVAATTNPAAAVPTTPASTIGNARAALMAAGVE